MPKKNKKHTSALTPFEYLAIVCFFFSGFAGLIYEIAWIRKSSLIFGSTTYAVSTVVAVFFGGMAIGSYVFGKITKKVVNTLKVFAVLEIFIGILGFLTPFLFIVGDKVYTLYYHALFSNFVALTLSRLLLIALIILPSSFLIGATLPLFCRYFVRDDKSISFFVALLYAINTLGAVAGCAACGFILIPFIGVKKAIFLAAIINMGIGLILLTVKRSVSPVNTVTQKTDKKTTPSIKGGVGATTRLDTIIAALFFITGFTALANEILWTRYITLIIHNTVYVYTLTLFIILSGITCGGLISIAISKKINNFGLIFGIINIMIAITVFFVIMLPYTFWKDVIDNQSIFTQLWIIAITFFIPSVFSGISFPIAIRMVTHSYDATGVKVGTMNALNTAGGIFGSLVAAFFILPLLGLQKSVLLTTGLSLGVGIIAVIFISGMIRKRIKIGIVVAAFLIWLLIPILSKTTIPADFLGDADTLVEYKEGVNANIAVVNNRYNIPVLEIDRLWQGEKVKSHQIMAAHIPMLLHQNPEDILVIGVGVGQTPGRFLYYDINSLDCVDIEKELFGFIKRHFDADWLDDERVSIIVEDGRNYISNTRNTYDLVSIEIGQVFRPGCAAFYTHDFYTQVKERLNPGGLVSQFVPLVFFEMDDFKSIIKTFIEVFPNSTLWFNSYELLLIGGCDTKPVLTTERMELLKQKSIHDDLFFYYWGGPENTMNKPDVFAASFLMDNTGLQIFTSDASIFYDDIPVLEYKTARLQQYVGKKIEDMLNELYPYLDSPRIIFDNQPQELNLPAVATKQRRNLQNIIAMDLYRQYLETDNTVLLQEAFKRNPENTDVLYSLGLYHGNEGNIAQAGRHFEKLLMLDRDHVLAHKGLGYVYSQQGRIEDAIMHYKRYLLLSGDKDASIHNNLAVIYINLKDYHNAVTHFERAVELDPSLDSAKRNLEKARALYEKHVGDE